MGIRTFERGSKTRGTRGRVWGETGVLCLADGECLRAKRSIASTAKFGGSLHRSQKSGGKTGRAKETLPGKKLLTPAGGSRGKGFATIARESPNAVSSS